MIIFREDQDLFINNPTMNLLEEEENFDSFIQFQPRLKQLNEDIDFFEDFFPLRRERIIFFNLNDVKRRGRYNLSNIKRKIKSHFIRFLIEFCNDALKEENINIQNNLRINKFFLPTMNIIYDNNFNFKEKTIKDILKLDLSNKYRIYGRDGNRKLLEEIELLSPTLTDLYQMNSLNLFKYYYNKEKPLNKIKFENKEIYLSLGTKSFYDLLEKNKDSRKEIIEATTKYFLDEEIN